MRVVMGFVVVSLWLSAGCGSKRPPSQPMAVADATVASAVDVAAPTNADVAVAIADVAATPDDVSVAVAEVADAPAAPRVPRYAHDGLLGIHETRRLVFREGPDPSTIAGVHPDGRVALAFMDDEGNDVRLVAAPPLGKATRVAESDPAAEAWVADLRAKGFVATVGLIATAAEFPAVYNDYVALVGLKAPLERWLLRSATDAKQVSLRLVSPDNAHELALATVPVPKKTCKDCPHEQIAAAIEEVVLSGDGKNLFVVLTLLGGNYDSGRRTLYTSVSLSDEVLAKAKAPLPPEAAPFFHDDGEELAGEPQGQARKRACDASLAAASCDRLLCQCRLRKVVRGEGDLRGAALMSVELAPDPVLAGKGVNTLNRFYGRWTLLIETPKGWTSLDQPLFEETSGGHDEETLAFEVDKLTIDPARAGERGALLVLDARKKSGNRNGETVEKVRWRCALANGDPVCRVFTEDEAPPTDKAAIASELDPASPGSASKSTRLTP